MSVLLQDIRFAFRTLVKTPSVTIFAVLSLALGIGANAAIFSVVDAFFWRPFPVEDPGRLVTINTTDQKNAGFLPVSRLNFEDFRDKTDVFTGVAAVGFAAVDVTVEKETNRVPVLIATGNYFDVVGVRPILGAGFRADQDEPIGKNPVVVLSNGYWKRRFAADRSIAGRRLTVNRMDYTIVGVLPETFNGTFPGFVPDLWVPYGMRLHIQPAVSFMTEKRRGLWLAPIARLKPGVTKLQAEAALKNLAAALEKEYPDANRGRSVALQTMSDARANPLGAAQNPLPRIAALLLVAVGVILLIATANVANLLLARASSRRKEIAVRIAIGATRNRLLRQLMAESFLLAAVGAAAGILLASWLTKLLMTLQPPGPFPFALGARIDWRVLLFTVVVAAATGILFGLFPALQASNPDVLGRLNEGGRQSGVGARGGMRRTLVIAEVALATIALAGTGLLLRSLREATAIDPGFRAEKVLALNLDVSLQGYDAERGAQFYKQLVSRVAALPGVKSADIASRAPLAFGFQRTVIIEGEVPSEKERGVLVNVATVGADYFRTLEIPIASGRAFGLEDTETSPPAAIINQTMAKRFWPGREPIGQSFRFPLPGKDGEFTPPIRVVGVARDSKYVTLGEQPIPFVYQAARQNYTPAMNLLVATVGEPSTVLPQLRQEVVNLDPGLPIFNVRPLTQQIEGALFLARVGAFLLAAFGALALVLTTVGTYSVLAYTVSRRVPEIGLRMALGAGPGTILGMIIRNGMSLVGVGLAVGIAASLALARSLTPILFGVKGTDPATYAGITALLGIVALAACYVPARRAAGVDPTVALRQE
ncbi:MAG TPA: ABC transporter permease [Thermoanaerobaculia bacterium]|nr:ABC transporter permease [Thermoanaerobaculia bacterium]